MYEYLMYNLSSVKYAKTFCLLLIFLVPIPVILD